ncbi:hypothetical protein JFJ09_04010 [Pseudoalteromonas arctica]|uniref:hypothetical protein n=1 Tax=Pseudoalteromonas arctica TaxID=394751 RepID=UPI001C9C32C6|nr:hypothetical protein [Pseudoalteromonas arctica]MBZ2191378.1 hypothetical protein [Pseudoalteromonas arctica]|tara:strand:+ start:5862 stop:6839 length:978 start_codon:yes stop_codon:yes gene_type:complete
MKVLLFSPDTFGYYTKIINVMETKGHSVDWINHIYVKSNFDRVKSRLMPSLTSKLTEKYFINEIDWQGDYELIVAIKGEGLSEFLLDKMKQTFSKAKFVYYSWDSLSNVKGAKGKFKYFDAIKSFDRVDCQNIEHLEYLPLFYSKEYSRKVNSVTDNKYSAAFVGTLHSNRFSDVLGMASLVEKNLNKPAFTFFYYPSKPVFKVLKVINEPFRKVPIEEVSFDKLSAQDVSRVMCDSEVIIDYGHPDQTGLTMRTIETLGINKKLITNNRLIMEEPFYKTENIFVIGEQNEQELAQFLTSPYVPVSKEVHESYAIENWVERLIQC